MVFYTGIATKKHARQNNGLRCRIAEKTLQFLRIIERGCTHYLVESEKPTFLTEQRKTQRQMLENK
jgi:hypothetical protein